ncbi:cytochrome c-type biogenesis protein [Pseudomonas sp. Marseille-QA0892]
MSRLFQAVCLALMLCGAAHAAIDTYRFDNEADRVRYRHLVEELRCPKCQNQNIADSNAPIAKDLRGEIHRMLVAGRSDGEIIDHLVLRYGDFVLYKPRLTTRTLLLWYGPAGLLVLGLGVLAIIVLRRRGYRKRAAQGLTDEERRRLAALLEKTSDKHVS